jgi:hypothetical protein
MAARAINDDVADYSFLVKQCSSAVNCCSVNVRFRAIRWPQCRRYPAAGVKGITVERSSNLVGVAAPPRPLMLATGIIGGIADCVPVGAAAADGAPPRCIAVPAVVTEGAAPVQVDGTDNAPTEVARPMPAERDGRPAPMPVEPRTPGLDTSPTAWAAPNSLAAVVAALAAVAVLPAVNSLDSMLIGIDASFSGVLSSFINELADVEDVDESVAVATLSRACGDARVCRT